MSDANYIQGKSSCSPIRNSKIKANSYHPYLKVAQVNAPAYPDTKNCSNGKHFRKK